MSMMPSKTEALRAIRREPLTFLTERRLQALRLYFGGREEALTDLGLELDGPSFSDRIEQHFGIPVIPSRNWVDLMESFAADGFDAFERFLALAATWPESVPPPAPRARPASVVTLVDKIVERPQMYLGETSIFRFADFMRGYLDALAAASASPDDATDVQRFFAEIPRTLGDEAGRSWFKAVRFVTTNEEHAFHKLVELWRGRT